MTFFGCMDDALAGSKWCGYLSPRHSVHVEVSTYLWFECSNQLRTAMRCDRSYKLSVVRCVPLWSYVRLGRCGWDVTLWYTIYIINSHCERYQWNSNNWIVSLSCEWTLLLVVQVRDTFDLWVKKWHLSFMIVRLSEVHSDVFSIGSSTVLMFKFIHFSFSILEIDVI